MAPLIYRQVSDLHSIFVAALWFGGLTAPQKCLDPVFELARAEGFREVIISAGLEARDLVVEHVVGSQEKRGRIDPAVTQLSQQFNARHFRHRDIKNEAIETIGCDSLECGCGTFFFSNFKS